MHSTNAQVSLRSHYDGVRDVVFHPHAPQLFSAGEDGAVKVWEVDLAARRIPADIEPVTTFRGHSCGRLGGG
jgi:WD40 repeat protein